jgi:ABC-type polysaccharide/polyol phosphate export permease
LPFLIVLMGVLGLGLGMIISSLVTKYRFHLIGFGVQLLMYVSAVVYPLALVQQKNAMLFGSVQSFLYYRNHALYVAWWVRYL